MRSAAFAVEATLVFLASRINEKMIKINSNSIQTRIKCAQQPSRLKPPLCFGRPGLMKIDQNQFKFNSNSNKMRSAAFAVEATLVFLASRINEKLIKINSNSIQTRIKCAQQPSRLKPPLCFWLPGSIKNSKSIKHLPKFDQNSMKIPPES
jgi:hypothetical protein